MKHSKYHQEIGATADFTKRMVKATKGIGHKSRKGTTEDCFIFEIWFSSKKSAEDVMDAGVKIIGMVKTNIKGLCKHTIDNLARDWMGGFPLVLRIKPILPGVRPLISIGYNYNVRKVIYFIFASKAGTKKVGITYYLITFTYFIIFTFTQLLVPFSCI